MKNKRFPNYPDDTDYTTSAPSYYDDLARKQKLIELLSKRIWEYDERLDKRLEDLENILQDYLSQWDDRIENLDDEVSHIFIEWLNDGTLEQIINHDVLGNKADKSYVDDFNENVTDQLLHMKENTIYLEDQPRLDGEATHAWIARIINKTKFGRVVAKSGKTYYIGQPIKITSSDVYMDFNGASLASQGLTGYQIEISNANNVTIENVSPTKIEADTGKFLLASNVSDLTVRGIHGSVTGFNTFLDLKGVSRSRFQDINIKNSNTTKKGTGIYMDYCVNVNFDSIYLEYFTNAVHATAIRSGGTTGYMNEGLSFTNFFTIKQNVGFQVEQCTELQLNNVVLDFCASYGLYLLNGLSTKINNYWIGLQDGGVTGIEVVNGVNITATNGTIAGDWSKKGTQKAFYSAIDTLMSVNNVYLIDINGGNLNRSKISVSGDTYFQTGQTKIVRYETGVVTLVFDGELSPSVVFDKAKTYFTIYSYDKNNVENFIKSDGYVNDGGITHISKIATGGTGTTINHVVDVTGFKVKLDSTYSMTAYKTIMVRHIPKDVYFRPE